MPILFHPVPTPQNPRKTAKNEKSPPFWGGPVSCLAANSFCGLRQAGKKVKKHVDRNPVIWQRLRINHEDGATEMPTVTQEYLDGIREGRETLRRCGLGVAQQELDNLTRTCRRFDAQSAVGQMLRGERDFWRNQVKKGK